MLLDLMCFFPNFAVGFPKEERFAGRPTERVSGLYETLSLNAPWDSMQAGNNLIGFTNMVMQLDTSK